MSERGLEMTVQVRAVVQRMHLMDADVLEPVRVRLERIESVGGSPLASGTTMSATAETWSSIVSGPVDDTTVRTGRAYGDGQVDVAAVAVWSGDVVEDRVG